MTDGLVRRGGRGQLQAKPEVSEAGDALEQNADSAATAMVDGQPAEVASGGEGSAVQRNPLPPGNRPGREGTHQRPPLIPWTETPGINPVATEPYPHLAFGALDVLGMINEMVQKHADRQNFTRQLGVVADWEKKKFMIANTPELRWNASLGQIHGTSLFRDPGAMGSDWTRKPEDIPRPFFDVRHLPWISPELEPVLNQKIQLACTLGTMGFEVQFELGRYFALVGDLKRELKKLTIDNRGQCIDPRAVVEFRKILPAAVLGRTWAWFDPTAFDEAG